MKKLFLLALLLVNLQLFAQNPFEREIVAYEKKDSLAMPPKGQILFLGSSSFRLWKSFDSDMAGIPAFNRGFGGSTLKDALYYFDRMVVKYKPSWVFLYEGDNDLAKGQSPEEIRDEFIEFKARFGGKPRDIMVPIHRVMAIYARENGQGMSFPVTDSPLNSTVLGMDKLNKVSHAPDATEASKTASPDSGDKPVPPTPTRPTLTRIK